MPQTQSLIMIALLVVGFYFLILRPQKKRQQAVQKTLRELAPGTRVLLNSGLFGTITALGDRQAVIEIAPGVEITVLKAAIARSVNETDEDQAYEDEDDDIDQVEEPQRYDPPPSSVGPTTSASTPTSGGSDAYQPSSTYHAPEIDSTNSGPEPTNPTPR